MLAARITAWPAGCRMGSSEGASPPWRCESTDRDSVPGETRKPWSECAVWAKVVRSQKAHVLRGENSKSRPVSRAAKQTTFWKPDYSPICWKGWYETAAFLGASDERRKKPMCVPMCEHECTCVYLYKYSSRGGWHVCANDTILQASVSGHRTALKR